MNQTPANSAASTKIGLVAGWGGYPVAVARAMKRQGYTVYCVAIKDHADPVLRRICDDFYEIGLGRLGAGIRYFRNHRVCKVTMAGKVHKVQLFERFAWLKHLPDWHTIRAFYPHFVTTTKDCRDDTLLRAVVDAYAAEGITVAPATDFAPELLVKFGQLSGRRLSVVQRKDIEFGWQIARELGRIDVGQSVAVKNRAVLAVEAIEGTDQCIRRAGELCEAGRFTVVKVAKPQQDMRFDVPTIGLGTLRTMVEARAGVLAVEADKTIIVDQTEVIALANRHRVKLVALHEDGLGKRAEAA